MTYHQELIGLIVAYTLAGAFVFTVVVTCLSLVGWIKIPDPRQQQKLFYVVIVEVAIIGVGSFSGWLQFDPRVPVQSIKSRVVVSEGSKYDRTQDLAARKPEDIKQRLAKADTALAAASGEYKRWLELADAAMMNAEAGSPEKAKSYAQELLRLAPKYSEDWNFGNAVHKGNLTLGRVALRAGDTEAAKKFLLEAGRTPGSPQLNSFGPNMTLGKELLEKGERDAVLEYFQLCANFWEMDRGRLREWSALVKKGLVPDFGANLLY